MKEQIKNFLLEKRSSKKIDIRDDLYIDCCEDELHCDFYMKNSILEIEIHSDECEETSFFEIDCEPITDKEVWEIIKKTRKARKNTKKTEDLIFSGSPIPQCIRKLLP